MVFVTVVPMFAPMTMGTALAIGSAFSGAATSATIIDVVTDELWTSVVARTPTINAMNGFSVAAKNDSSTSRPRDLNPSPSPLTPTRKTKRSARTMSARTSGWRVNDSKEDCGALAGFTSGSRPCSLRRESLFPSNRVGISPEGLTGARSAILTRTSFGLYSGLYARRQPEDYAFQWCCSTRESRRT